MTHHRQLMSLARHFSRLDESTPIESKLNYPIEFEPPFCQGGFAIAHSPREAALDIYASLVGRFESVVSYHHQADELLAELYYLFETIRNKFGFEEFCRATADWQRDDFEYYGGLWRIIARYSGQIHAALSGTLNGTDMYCEIGEIIESVLIREHL